MSNQKEKKNIVITEWTILRIVFVITILSVIGFIISELVRGTPFLHIFTDIRNLPIWIGALSVSILNFSLSETKKADDNKPQ